MCRILQDKLYSNNLALSLSLFFLQLHIDDSWFADSTLSLSSNHILLPPLSCSVRTCPLLLQESLSLPDSSARSYSPHCPLKPEWRSIEYQHLHNILHVTGTQLCCIFWSHFIITTHEKGNIMSIIWRGNRGQRKD